MALYGFRLIKSPAAAYEQLADFIGKNSEVFAEGDAVFVNSDGFLEVAGSTDHAGVKLVGICGQTVTMSSSNQTVAMVKPVYYPAQGNTYITETDANIAQTDLDTAACYADIVGDTGAMLVNTAGGSTGQFRIVRLDPNQTGSVREVLVKHNTAEVLDFGV